jgi:hypothetical protein
VADPHAVMGGARERLPQLLIACSFPLANRAQGQGVFPRSSAQDDAGRRGIVPLPQRRIAAQAGRTV